MLFGVRAELCAEARCNVPANQPTGLFWPNDSRGAGSGISGKAAGVLPHQEPPGNLIILAAEDVNLYLGPGVMAARIAPMGHRVGPRRNFFPHWQMPLEYFAQVGAVAGLGNPAQLK